MILLTVRIVAKVEAAFTTWTLDRYFKCIWIIKIDRFVGKIHIFSWMSLSIPATLSTSSWNSKPANANFYWSGNVYLLISQLPVTSFVEILFQTLPGSLQDSTVTLLQAGPIAIHLSLSALTIGISFLCHCMLLRHSEGSLSVSAKV